MTKPAAATSIKPEMSTITAHKTACLTTTVFLARISAFPKRCLLRVQHDPQGLQGHSTDQRCLSSLSCFLRLQPHDCSYGELQASYDSGLVRRLSWQVGVSKFCECYSFLVEDCDWHTSRTCCEGLCIKVLLDRLTW